jgi:hypothetical protein
MRALAVLYFLVCYVAGVSRLFGWFKGVRLARERRRGLAKADRGT